MLKKFIQKYYLILLGGILFSLYFWNRFLRSRTSKDLPIHLDIYKFMIYLYICLIFLYIVISLVNPRQGNASLERIVEWLFTPIVEFDKYLKSINVIKKCYDKLLEIIMPTLEFMIIKTNLFYVIFWIFPRLILLTALYVDVFIFHQFHYKYFVILFGLLLFINRYFKFSLKKSKKELIDYYTPYIRGVNTAYYPGIDPIELEPDYNLDDYEDDLELMTLSLDVFINFKVEFEVHRDIIIEVHSFVSEEKLHFELWERHIGGIDYGYGKVNQSKHIPLDYKNIFGDKVPENYFKASHFIFEKRQEFAKDALEKALKIALLLEYYNKISNHDKK